MLQILPTSPDGKEALRVVVEAIVVAIAGAIGHRRGKKSAVGKEAPRRRTDPPGENHKPQRTSTRKKIT